MYVLEVLPLAAGAPAGTLSYRAKERLAPGTIVDITLRTTKTRGVVIDCLSVQEAKSSLKAASFMLKAGAPSRAGSVPSALIVAAESIATYHAAALGPTLATLMGAAFAIESLPSIPPSSSDYHFQTIEDSFEKRVAAYQKIITAAHKKQEAVLLVAPTTIELARFAKIFEDQSPLVLSSTGTPKKREAALAEALGSKKLVLATPAYAGMPFAHLGTIILERISSGSYVMQKRPYLDMRIAAQKIAEARRISFVAGDFPLPIEWRVRPEKALAAAPESTIEIIDARKERAEDEAFKAVPDRILRAMKPALAKNGRIAVLAVRKGYSPAVVCRDCGTAVHDAEGRQLAFATTRGERIFRSADGATRRAADTACDVCGSWNLLPLGIGVERVVEEVRNEFPDAFIVQIDTNTVRTPTQAKKIAEEIQKPGTIIIGTEFMLPFLDPTQPLEYAAIASADALLALPFWRARERLIHLGMTLLERSKKLSIATRRPEDAAFAQFATPAETAFFTEETALRKQFGYPPFGHLVIVHAEVPQIRKETLAKAIKQAFGDHAVIRLPDRVTGTKARLAFVAKYPNDTWPTLETAAALAALPPFVKVTIDGESLW